MPISPTGRVQSDSSWTGPRLDDDLPVLQTRNLGDPGNVIVPGHLHNMLADACLHRSENECGNDRVSIPGGAGLDDPAKFPKDDHIAFGDHLRSGADIAKNDDGASVMDYLPRDDRVADQQDQVT